MPLSIKGVELRDTQTLVFSAKSNFWYLTISEKPGWGIEPNKDWLESSNYQYFDGK